MAKLQAQFEEYLQGKDRDNDVVSEETAWENDYYEAMIDEFLEMRYIPDAIDR
ncbi:MAG: hypothetical protein M0R38_13300 [Bacteroidia bacterium]|nr:hypothetical protein [Bacteroidia bacterium]